MNKAVSDYCARSNKEQLQLSEADRRERTLRNAEGADQLELFPLEEITVCTRVLAFLKFLRV